MSAITAIVLADALSTPVDHTFHPALQGLVGKESVAEFEDRDANSGIAVGFNRIHLSFSRPTPQRRTYHVNVKVSTPVLETISNSTASGILPAPQVAYTPLFEGRFVLPERSNPQNRKDLRKFVAGLLANASLIAAIENLDPPL